MTSGRRGFPAQKHSSAFSISCIRRKFRPVRLDPSKLYFFEGPKRYRAKPPLDCYRVYGPKTNRRPKTILLTSVCLLRFLPTNPNYDGDQCRAKDLILYASC